MLNSAIHRVNRAFTNRRYSIGLRVLLLTGFVSTMSAKAVTDDTCLMCHGRNGSSIPYVDKNKVGNSVHGRNGCVSCHRTAQPIPHPNKLAPPACSNCHPSESRIYLNSRHGQAAKRGRTDAAVCSDCHGKGHEIFSSKSENSPVFRRNIVDTCARCHSDPKRMSGIRLAEMDPVQSYRKTIHGQAFEGGNDDSAVCTDCHGTHGLFNSLNPRSLVYRRNIPDTCGKCHEEIDAIYKKSIHGKAALEGARESPVCTDCHGRGHALRPSSEPGSPTSVEAITRTCASCHESQKIIRKFDLPLNRLSTYQESYHGLAARRGNMKVANCASCHGDHAILPADDPASSINKANLAQTCGQCHPGAGDKLSLGNIHGSPGSKHWTLGVAQRFYWIAIPLALVMMVLHNGLDWIKKAFTGYRDAVATDTIRFTVNERMQHFILLTTFIILALTGFALKYPDAFWVKYLALYDEVLRRSIHRWAALIFALLSAYHLLYIAGTRRGRCLLGELIPRWDDVKDIFAVSAFNLGIRKSPSVYTGFFRYPEKIEYWALVWGALVMMISGAVLVFNNFSLEHFPLWVSDLATFVHYYEAILGCLAILVWHFYRVIFDPDVYPMNCTWLSGRIRCAGNKRVFLNRIPYGRY